jgi:hypothetical protein
MIQFYAPSNLCGARGKHQEVLHANPSSGETKCFDIVLVSLGNDDDWAAMQGLMVAWIWLLFLYFDPYHQKDIPCTLITWFVHPDGKPECDKETGMWKVVPKCNADNKQLLVQVIHLETIF